MNRRLAAPLVCGLLLGLAGCAGSPPRSAPAPGADNAKAATGARKVSPYAPAKEDPSKRGNYTAGGLYAPGVADSAPDAEIDVSLIPEPEVVAEPRSRYGNRSTYSVLGKKYHVLDDAEGYVEEGLASYYGTKFHGRKTSNMEVYDMYAFTAAHKTLPLPSYARVTNLDNGKTVVVRVNDRGPFHKGRIIDLSYTAALKLDVLNGVAPVEIERITYEDIRTGAWTRDRDTLSPDPKVAPDTPVYAAATPSGAPDLTTTAQLRPPVNPVPAQVPTQVPTQVPAQVPAQVPTQVPAQVSAQVPLPDAGMTPIPITALPPGSDLPPSGQSKADAMATATAGAIAATDPQAPVPALQIAAAQGYWLQFGAFSRMEGAEQLRERFTRGMEELAPMLTIFKDKNLHRLQAGPFASREDARAAADRVRTSMALTPILVERR